MNSEAIPINIEQICSDPSAIEALEETTPFLGIAWDDVAPELWWEHSSALYYFTPEAFRYYLPSVWKCSKSDYFLTHLAISAVVGGVCDDEYFSAVKECWLNLPQEQRVKMLDWLEWLKAAEETQGYGWVSDAEKAHERLSECWRLQEESGKISII